MPGGANTGNQNWSPYIGVSFRLDSRGYIIMTKGYGGGAGSQHRRTFKSNYPMINGKWNMVVCRYDTLGTANTSTNENHMKIYRPITSNLIFSKTGVMVYSPGHSSRYFRGSIGHHYIFNEPTDDSKINNDEFSQIADATNSGSFTLYTP